MITLEKHSENRRTAQRKALQQMCLLDDTFMTAFFDGDKKRTQIMLNIIFEDAGIGKLMVKSVRVQETLTNLTGRSVRLDIMARDQNGKLYNIEVQRATDGADIHRARYNHALIASKYFKKKKKFKDLPEVYVIFITESDIFKANKLKYTFEKRIAETGELVNDGEHTIYINTSYISEHGVTSNLEKLAHDFRCSEPSKMQLKEFAEKANRLKYTEKGVGNMCAIMDELCKKFEDEARADGQLATLYSLVQKGVLSLQDAAVEMNITEEELRAKFTKYDFVL